MQARMRMYLFMFVQKNFIEIQKSLDKFFFRKYKQGN